MDRSGGETVEGERNRVEKDDREGTSSIEVTEFRRRWEQEKVGGRERLTSGEVALLTVIVMMELQGGGFSHKDEGGYGVGFFYIFTIY